ncbi:MAG: hypothetical protein Q7V88_11485 [Actinomycetota bacterium]|nr:hypothetical protein [Actinomycetota bacterium]
MHTEHLWQRTIDRQSRLRREARRWRLSAGRPDVATDPPTDTPAGSLSRR